jgi:hypothetical protein
MAFLLRNALRRIPREGFKALAVPVLALVLVFLIGVLNGVRHRQEAYLTDVTENFEIRVEVSDPISGGRENLYIEPRFVNLFTDPTADPTLAHYLRDVLLKRTLRYEFLDGDGEIPTEGYLIGINDLRAEPGLSPEMGVNIIFFDGDGGDFFTRADNVCVVSEGLFAGLDPESPVFSFTAFHTRFDPDPPYAEAALRVVGIIIGGDGTTVYCPFPTLGNVSRLIDGEHNVSEIMRGVIANNAHLNGFKRDARDFFAAVGAIDARRAYALTVFDTTYHETLTRLRQNILMLRFSTPFIYILSVGIGFVASFLLTKRRKPEFAVMRSLGVGKAHLFAGALAEQIALCLAGAAAGSALYAYLWREWRLTPAVGFVVCYALGAAVTAARTAGTDALRVLRVGE